MTQSYFERLGRQTNQPVGLDEKLAFAPIEADTTKNANEQIDENTKRLNQSFLELGRYYEQLHQRNEKYPEQLLKLVGKGVNVSKELEAFNETQKQIGAFNKHLEQGQVLFSGKYLKDYIAETDDPDVNNYLLEKHNKDINKRERIALSVEALEGKDLELYRVLSPAGNAIDLSDMLGIETYSDVKKNYPAYLTAVENINVDVSYLYKLPYGSVVRNIKDSASLLEKKAVVGALTNWYLHENKPLAKGKIGKWKHELVRDLLKQRDAFINGERAKLQADLEKLNKEERAATVKYELENYGPQSVIDNIDKYKGLFNGSYKLGREAVFGDLVEGAEQGEVSSGSIEDIGDLEFIGHDGKPKVVRDYWKKDFQSLRSAATTYEASITDERLTAKTTAREASARELVADWKKSGPMTIEDRTQGIVGWMVANNVQDMEDVPDILKEHPYIGMEDDTELAQKLIRRNQNGGTVFPEDIEYIQNPDLKAELRRIVTAKGMSQEQLRLKGIFLNTRVDKKLAHTTGESGRTPEWYNNYANALNEYNRIFNATLAATGDVTQAITAAEQAVELGLAGGKDGTTDWDILPGSPVDLNSVRQLVAVKESLKKNKDLVLSPEPWKGEEPHLVAAAKYFNGDSKVFPWYYYQFPNIKKINGRAMWPQRLARVRLEATGMLKDGKFIFPEEENLTSNQQLSLAKNSPTNTYNITQQPNSEWVLETVQDQNAVSNGGYDYILDSEGEVAVLDKPLSQHTIGEIIQLTQQDYNNFGMYGIDSRTLLDLIQNNPVQLDDIFDQTTQDLLILAQLRKKANQAKAYSTLNPQYRRLVTLRPELREEYNNIVGELPPYLRLENMLPAVATEMVQQTLTV